jgi:hypothetical protein
MNKTPLQLAMERMEDEKRRKEALHEARLAEAKKQKYKPGTTDFSRKEKAWQKAHNPLGR